MNESVVKNLGVLKVITNISQNDQDLFCLHSYDGSLATKEENIQLRDGS